jgi:tetratricopeptide (TPR) repeat protein
MLINRARAKLVAGNVDEAVMLAREALAITPGHIDLVSAMVPELDRKGKKKLADELFQTVWSTYQKLLMDFPDSPFARNALALLSANCQRELDEGLKYAEAAVKADEHSVQYRETLAEVLFRKGARDPAVELMKKLVAEEPRNQFFRMQLKRYRTGEFDSPRPERVDQ